MAQPPVVDENGVAGYQGAPPETPMPPPCWGEHVDERNEEAAATYAGAYKLTYRAPLLRADTGRRGPQRSYRPGRAVTAGRARRSRSARKAASPDGSSSDGEPPPPARPQGRRRVSSSGLGRWS
jgi:hypothetical protein